MACPKLSYERSVFGFLAQPPPPGLSLVNPQPPRRLHIINPHPPPPTIISHCRFTRHARNRATNAQFQDFGPKPRPPGAQPNERPQPQPHLTYLTTATHHNKNTHHSTQ